jgi:hypothetical protein
MTKHGAAWLPKPLYNLLADWCEKHPQGEIRLYHTGGRITDYSLTEKGQVRYANGEAHLEREKVGERAG